ncbi:fibrinogen C domain-containing protein 1-like [Littorina saxatilis]|uniref:fibrinogen C domain-containing protein 1-like n=1 Tax=Littorina saxatilis TaxID=31220 RepID=UPI0038B5849B
MTSTRFRMIGVALFVVALSALEAYQWDGGPEDKAKMTACLGGSASFPWSILTGSETILNIEWSFQAPDKEKTTIATNQSTHFYATDSVRLGFLANAGLSLRFARPQDSGNYSVRVQLQRAKSSELVSAERTVTLSVTDRAPATQDGDLYFTLGDVVRDDVTEDWTLQLHCVQFVDLGHPPVDVVWKTPSGEVRNSSYQDNGTFVLSLSSPVQGGNYSCQLPPSAPAARCLTATSPLNAAAQLYLDDKDARLSFLGARQRELEQVNEDQANLLQHQAMQISQQNRTMADMVRVNEDQANLLQHQAMQISQQNRTMADMVRVNEDQANLLQHQAMQISQQNRTMADMVRVNKDQANLLQHQAMQISRQNRTMADMVRVNKDYANLLQHQNGTIGEMKADQLNLTTQLSALTNSTKNILERITPANCVDWLKLDPRSGIRTVNISGDPITVYCDQTTDNGGWIVFQRRQDASVDFNQNWTEYRNGFGDLEGSFWLGLDKLHKLTTSQTERDELRIDLHLWDGTKANARFSNFYVEDVSHNFTLRFDKFTGGNAGDSLDSHRGQQFSTKDRDNDRVGYSCAKYFGAGWWFKSCYSSNLNGHYMNSSSGPNRNGLVWGSLKAFTYSMKFTEMKIRPI